MVTLINSALNENLVMCAVKDSLLHKEVRRKKCCLITTPNHYKALFTDSRWRRKTRMFHERDKSENRGKLRRKSKTKKELYATIVEMWGT